MSERVIAMPEGVRIVEADAEALRLAEVAIRWDVFVVEQHVPLVLEIDARDQRVDIDHFVAVGDGWREGDEALACVRIVPDGVGSDGRAHFHLGRLAVRRQWRGRGLGAALVDAVHEHISARLPQGGSALVALNAQVQAQGFYERLGYRATTGEVFLDAGIEHREMTRLIDART